LKIHQFPRTAKVLWLAVPDTIGESLERKSLYRSNKQYSRALQFGEDRLEISELGRGKTICNEQLTTCLQMLRFGHISCFDIFWNSMLRQLILTQVLD